MYEKNLDKHFQLRISSEDMDYLVKESLKRRQSVGSVIRSYITYFRLNDVLEVQDDTQASINNFV